MKGRIFLLLAVLVLAVLALSSCRNDNELKYIDIQLTNEDYAFGVNKDNSELLKEANLLLSEIKENGQLDEIIDKYVTNDSSRFVTVDAGNARAQEKTLVVATHIPFSPFEYKIGSRYCGIDIEIASLLAKRLDATLVIKEVHFNEILDCIQNGEADIAMSGISISEPRKEKVAFTDTYFKAAQVIVARKSDTVFDKCQDASDVEEILLEKSKQIKVGYQSGTTSQNYIIGDTKSGYNGFSVVSVPYESALDAAEALRNGEIDYVVVDRRHAQAIVEALNK